MQASEAGRGQTVLSDWSTRLAEDWDRLAVGLGTTPFMRPGWFSAWQAGFGGRWRIVTDWDADGHLRGVLPLVGRFGILDSPTNWHTAEFGVVATDGATLDRLLGAAIRAAPGRLRLSFVDDELEGRLRAVAAQLGRPSSSRVYQESRFVPAPSADVPSPAEGLSADKRKKSRRWRRQLAEQGSVALTVVHSTDDRALERFFAVEDASWKSSAGTSILEDAPAAVLYRQFAEWAAQRGLLRIALLQVDDAVVAGDLAVEDGGVHYVLKTGFDELYAAARPGWLLRLDMLERAHAAGLRYEFLGSDAEWKRRWTPHVRARHRVTVYGRGPVGRLCRAVDTWGRPVAKVLLARLRGHRARSTP